MAQEQGAGPLKLLTQRTATCMHTLVHKHMVHVCRSGRRDVLLPTGLQWGDLYVHRVPKRGLEDDPRVEYGMSAAYRLSQIIQEEMESLRAEFWSPL